MLKEFKTFILRGNVIDLAVGVIIGTAFGKIVSSLVADILMPPLGILLSEVDFRRLAWTLETGPDGLPIQIAYGNFLSILLDFFIVAAAVFALVKVANRVQTLARRDPNAPPAPPNTRECPECAMEVPVKARKCGHCQTALAG